MFFLDFVLDVGNVLYFCTSFMKTLHLFNPEHDIALAAGLSNFTAPYAGRKLRTDLAYLPALWAAEGDVVLVDDVEQAISGYRRLFPEAVGHPCFVTKEQLSHLEIARVDPWGWDSAIRAQLLRYGVRAVASEDDVAMVRRLSHRRTSAQLLPSLRLDGTVGEAVECRMLQQVEECQQRWGQIVVKAPWSSSGRGVRFSVQQGWINNIIKHQGSVMAEPLYEKVMDFGMEFVRDDDGRVRYLGLSLFHAKNGAYIGNLLAAEEEKCKIMARYLPLELLDTVRQRIIDNALLDDYRGPFGIDMMVVSAEGGYRLHPCVEINLRRTMGHVALALSAADVDGERVMRIMYDGNSYQLSIEPFHAE